MEVVNFRHACKVFDKTKKISDEDIKYILEVRCKSLSSFGMEAWKFLVVTNEELKAKIRPVCWNQVQITSCSHLVLVLAGIQNLKVESDIPKKRFERRKMPQEMIDNYLDIYASHLKQVLSSDENIYSWSARQTYIATGNMMSAGAF